MTYVIVCGPVPALPANVAGYELNNNLANLRAIPCVEKATVVNVTVVARVAAINKPYCDGSGACNGAIYQTQ